VKLYSKKIIALIALVLFFTSSGIVQAKVRAVNARRNFEQSVAKESMVVALFYDGLDKGLMRIYEDIGNHQEYDDADVVFLKVNAARKELGELASLYGVSTMPTFIFFHKGKRVVDRNGVPIVLAGLVSRDQLQSFIDEHYGAEIKKYITKKDARSNQRLAQENDRGWREYFYPRTINTQSYGPDERDLE
jgi:thioredoxin-like negative regulator of GroEL